MRPEDVQSLAMTERQDSPEQPRGTASFGDRPASPHFARDAYEADQGAYGERSAADSSRFEGRAHPGRHDESGEGEQAPDRTARVYVGLWLPTAGALVAYALMRGNYWAAFIGTELLLVGWFTLGKL